MYHLSVANNYNISLKPPKDLQVFPEEFIVSIAHCARKRRNETVRTACGQLFFTARTTVLRRADKYKNMRTLLKCNATLLTTKNTKTNEAENI